MSDNNYYILQPDHSVKAVPLMEWAQWFENASSSSENFQARNVAQTTLPWDIKISTVFLGMNYRFGEGPPLIFETMIFGGKHDQYPKIDTPLGRKQLNDMRKL